MSAGARQLKRIWRSIPLPTLGQGGTLSIHSSLPRNCGPLTVLVKPEWRNDAHISLEQIVPPSNRSSKNSDYNVSSDVKMIVTTHEKGLVTSMGRTESHVSIHLSVDSEASSSELLGEEDATDLSMEAKDSNITKDGLPLRPHVMLTAIIPEKLNLNCTLDDDGGQGQNNIIITEKMEGDVKFSTMGGNVTAKKIRGHHVHMDAQGGTIHISQLLEAQTVHLATTCQGRIRAKMINGSDVSLQVTDTPDNNVDDNDAHVSDATTKNRRKAEALDIDDQLAFVDVGSLYTSWTGDGAFINVMGAPITFPMVRIKSNHGNICVNANMTGSHEPLTSDCVVDEFGQRRAILDLGGVNGSCDVSIQENGDHEEDGESLSPLAARIHFDSMYPDTVNLITTAGNNKAGHRDVGITLDRKIKAEVRLLSSPQSDDMDTDIFTSDDMDAVQKTVVNLANKNGHSPENAMTESRQDSNVGKKEDTIDIQTKSFTLAEENLFANNSIHFVAGSVENKSDEPDSRFDRKIRGDSGKAPLMMDVNRGEGKIRLDGAATQALQGFVKVQKHDNTSDSGSSASDNATQNPLLAVATHGLITLETVSWFGSIARRYGMDENPRDLGRQATRTPRL